MNYKKLADLMHLAKHISGKGKEDRYRWYEYFKKELSYVMGWEAGRHCNQELYQQKIQEIVDILKI